MCHLLKTDLYSYQEDTCNWTQNTEAGVDPSIPYDPSVKRKGMYITHPPIHFIVVHSIV